MPEAEARRHPSLALVLGGGGPVGITWLAGLARGLLSAGIDLTRADRIVGTSAGAVVGAALAAGTDLSTLLTQRPADSEPAAAPPAHDYSALLEISTLLRTADGADRELVLQRVGEPAARSTTGDPDAHLQRIGTLVNFAEWPDHDLLITSIDIGSGALTAWTRHDAATLVQALAASTAVPGVFPPIDIAGRHYIDGGVRSTINADLAAGYDAVVILEPLAHLYPRTRTDRNLDTARLVTIAPDETAVAAFGSDLFSPAALIPSYESGLRQAAATAAELQDFWPTT